MYATSPVASFFLHITLGSHELSWIDFELSELPSRDVVDEHFPANVQQMFLSNRAILLATEVQILKLTHRNAQGLAFYNVHTLKTMIGICITP